MKVGDEFMFFGTKADYKALAEKGDIKVEEDQKENKKIRTSPAINVSSDDTSTIDEETLKMLRRTRHLHDARIVYMQSDISFYDVFYRNSDDVIDDPELLQEARAIRRIYKTYPEYLYALHIRELYIEKLMEKVGNREMFNTLLRAGGIRDWMPPVPIYSKKAVDYDNGAHGIIDSSDLVEWDDDLLEAMIDELREYRGFSSDFSNLEIVGGVLTDYMSLSHSDPVNRDITERSSGKTSVNLADMEELQKIFRGWYQDDTAKDSKKEVVDNSLEARAFSKTPENIERQYYYSRVFDFSKEFKNVMNGIPNEPVYDPNEMVYDEVTSKPMTRREYDARCLVRTLKKSGWTDELKVMKLMNVGSSREYSIMKRKANNKKRKANKTVRSYTSSSDDTGIYGDSNLYGNTGLFSDLDSLKAHMFPD